DDDSGVLGRQGRARQAAPPDRGPGRLTRADGRRGALLHRRPHPDRRGLDGARGCGAGDPRRPRDPLRRRRLRLGGRGRRPGHDGRPAGLCTTLRPHALMLAVGVGSELVDALSFAFGMFWEILWALILGYALSAVVQAVVSKRELRRLLPDDSPRTLAVAT